MLDFLLVVSFDFSWIWIGHYNFINFATQSQNCIVWVKLFVQC